MGFPRSKMTSEPNAYRKTEDFYLRHLDVLREAFSTPVDKWSFTPAHQKASTVRNNLFFAITTYIENEGIWGGLDLEIVKNHWNNYTLAVEQVWNSNDFCLKWQRRRNKIPPIGYKRGFPVAVTTTTSPDFISSLNLPSDDRPLFQACVLCMHQRIIQSMLIFHGPKHDWHDEEIRSVEKCTLECYESKDKDTDRPIIILI